MGMLTPLPMLTVGTPRRMPDWPGMVPEEVPWHTNGGFFVESIIQYEPAQSASELQQPTPQEWHWYGGCFVLSSMQYDDGQSLSVLQLCAPWQTAASRLGVAGS